MFSLLYCILCDRIRMNNWKWPYDFQIEKTWLRRLYWDNFPHTRALAYYKRNIKNCCRIYLWFMSACIERFFSSVACSCCSRCLRFTMSSILAVCNVFRSRFTCSTSHFCSFSESLCSIVTTSRRRATQKNTPINYLTSNSRFVEWQPLTTCIDFYPIYVGCIGHCYSGLWALWPCNCHHNNSTMQVILSHAIWMSIFFVFVYISVPCRHTHNMIKLCDRWQ